MRSVFEQDKMTKNNDWQDGVNARLEWIKKEIEAINIKQSHYDKMLKNIKIDVDRAIKKCLNTLNIVNELP